MNRARVLSERSIVQIGLETCRRCDSSETKRESLPSCVWQGVLLERRPVDRRFKCWSRSFSFLFSNASGLRVRGERRASPSVSRCYVFLSRARCLSQVAAAAQSGLELLDVRRPGVPLGFKSASRRFSRRPGDGSRAFAKGRGSPEHCPKSESVRKRPRDPGTHRKRGSLPLERARARARVCSPRGDESARALTQDRGGGARAALALRHRPVGPHHRRGVRAELLRALLRDQDRQVSRQARDAAAPRGHDTPLRESSAQERERESERESESEKARHTLFEEEEEEEEGGEKRGREKAGVEARARSQSEKLADCAKRTEAAAAMDAQVATTWSEARPESGVTHSRFRLSRARADIPLKEPAASLSLSLCGLWSSLLWRVLSL